jgi:hypothetical protein
LIPEAEVLAEGGCQVFGGEFLTGQVGAGGVDPGVFRGADLGLVSSRCWREISR